MLIKAGAIANLTDARYFASKNADIIGLRLDREGKDGLLPQQAQEIMKWLAGPKVAGEFGKAEPRWRKETAVILGLDFIQADETATHVLGATPDIPLILECGFDATREESDLLKLFHEYSAQAAYFQVTCGNAQTITALEKITRAFPVILDYTGDVGDIPGIMHSLKPAGINVRGGSELRTGAKSFDELDELFRLLETEF